MTAGPFVGKPVAEAKTLTRAKMVADGDAITYLEPEGLVTPRSTPDIECVVALVDQWYLKYGQSEWQARVASHLETLECYNGAVAKAFRDALAWLSDWACSRSFGLGTRMPWDEQFLIESLSDSTIYMAYYTVAHLLQVAPSAVAVLAVYPFPLAHMHPDRTHRAAGSMVAMSAHSAYPLTSAPRRSGTPSSWASLTTRRPASPTSRCTSCARSSSFGTRWTAASRARRATPAPPRRDAALLIWQPPSLCGRTSSRIT